MRVMPSVNRRRPRLGIYEPSAGTSGPSRYVESLLTGIDRDEFDVVLFCRANGPYAAQDGIEQVPIDAGPPPVDSCHLPAGSAPSRISTRAWRAFTPKSLKLWSGFLRDAHRLARIFRQHPVDLLHTNNTGCEESPFAARLAAIPRIVGTFHVDSTYDLTGAHSHLRHRAIENVSNQCLHAAIAVSEATRQDWLRRTHLAHDRVYTIYNGITPIDSPDEDRRANARARLGLASDSVIIGGVGRLDHAKGFNDLLDAAAILLPNHPRLVVAIAGQGPLRESLEQRAARLNIAGRVRFLGFRPDVADVYAAIDIFALPSVCEALPYTLLDAMAAELPVVATTVGGVPEVVVQGETGYLVPPRNPRALAAALARLLTSPRLRNQLGAAARDRVTRQFDERQMVDKTLGLYRQLLDACPARVALAG
jgi:glycosyltransferase involved in cell wall biosynthesis